MLQRGNEKSGYNQLVSRSQYKIYDNASPYFLTCTIVRWIPLFNDPTLVEILLDSLRFLQQHNRLTIYAYVVMDHHLHLVAASENLSRDLMSFKSFTARKILDSIKDKGENELLAKLADAKARHKKDRTYQVWQEGSHPQAITNETMMHQKVTYIHQNPVERGFVDEPEAWRYSSAADYSGLSGLLEVRLDW